MQKFKKKSKTFEAKRGKYGYIFTAPYIIGSLFFIIYPIVLSIAFSLSKVSNDSVGFTMDYIGISNYKYMLFSDSEYNKTVVSTISDMLVNVPIVAIFSFFIASLLNQEFKGRGIARSVLFLPLIVSSTAVNRLLSSREVTAVAENLGGSNSSSAVDFSATLSDALGNMNIGTEIIDLLSSTVNNIGQVLAMSAIPIIIFLAALQSISPSIYEASYVEGATKWEVFWKISLPIISPMILVVIIYTIIDSFSNTGNAVIKTIHNLSFTGNIDIGKGCAAAWIYLIITMAIMGAVYLFVNRFVFYQDE